MKDRCCVSVSFIKVSLDYDAVSQSPSFHPSSLSLRADLARPPTGCEMAVYEEKGGGGDHESDGKAQK